MNKKIIIICFILIFIIGLRLSGIGKVLTLENLKNNADSLKSLAEEKGAMMIGLYIFIYIAVVALSVPGATIITITGGFLFGAFMGTIYTNVGASTGAVLVFLSSRYLIGNSIQKKYEHQLKRFNREIKKHGAGYLLTLRFIPLFPFFLINLLAGISNIRLRTFVWTTVVGIIPGSFVYAFAGSSLGTLNSVNDIFSMRILIAFVLLGLFALIPIMFKKYHSKKEKNRRKR